MKYPIVGFNYSLVMIGNERDYLSAHGRRRRRPFFIANAKTRQFCSLQLSALNQRPCDIAVIRLKLGTSFTSKHNPKYQSCLDVAYLFFKRATYVCFSAQNRLKWLQQQEENMERQNFMNRDEKTVQSTLAQLFVRLVPE